MTTVYQVIRSDTYGNSHFTNRDETWVTRKVQTFDTPEAAWVYVKEKERYNPAFVRLALNVPERESLLDRFCREPNYILDRNYHIERPTPQMIRQACEKAGIRYVRLS
jgi:hypothetical protein